MAMYPLIVALVTGVFQLWMLEDPQSSSLTSFLISQSLGQILMSGVVALACVINGWIHGRQHPPILILTCTAKIWVLIKLSDLLFRMLLEENQRHGIVVGKSAIICGTSITTFAMVAWLLWRAGRMWSVAAFFAECDPVDFIRRHWLARERAARKFAKGALREGKKRFARRLMGDLIPTLAYAMLGGAAAFLAISFLALSGRVEGALVLCALAGVLSLFLREHLGGKRYAVISGALRHSMRWRYVVLIVPILSVLLFLMKMGESIYDDAFLTSNISAVVLMMTLALFMTASRGGGKKLRIAAVVFGSFLVLSLACLALEEFGKSLAAVLSTMLTGTSVVLMSMLFAGLGSALMQEIHESEVIDHPVGMLSSDTPPADVADVIAAAQVK